MKTSLTNIKETEDFLLNNLTPENRLLYQAKLLLNPILRAKTSLQQKTYVLVQLYGRRKLKSEIAAVEERIFTDAQHSSFQQNVNNIF
jgi:hypothetical protein